LLYEGLVVETLPQHVHPNRPLSIAFSTVRVVVRLVDSLNKPLPGGVVTFAGPSWRMFGITESNGETSLEVLPGEYSFLMNYPGFSKEITQDVRINPIIVFQITTPLFPNSGIVSYWKMDENVGPAVADAVDGHDGMFGGPVIIPGKIGNGRGLVSTNDVIDFGTSMPRNNVYSINFWLKADNWITQHNLIVYASMGYKGWQVLSEDNTLRLKHYDGASGSTDIDYPLSGITTGCWHMISYSITPTNRRMYLDGALVAEQSFSATLDTTQSDAFIIGAAPTALQCQIDEIGYWSRELSSEEIVILFNSGTGLQAQDSLFPVASIVSYWKMDEETGPIVFDTFGGQDGMVRCPINVTGKIGNGIELTSTSDIIDFGTSMPRDNVYSVNFWLKVDNWITQHNLIVYASMGYRGWQVLSEDNTLRLKHYDGASGSTDIDYPLSGITTGCWHMISYSITPTNRRMYLDGFLVAEQSFSAILDTTQSDAFIIGAAPTALQCQIDEIGYWSRVLSADEISALYNNGAGLEYLD
jgi:hypothetical protein